MDFYEMRKKFYAFLRKAGIIAKLRCHIFYNKKKMEKC